MSSSVDEEVVRMRFDNNAFESGVAKTLSTIDKLRSMLKLTGATKGLQDVDAAANKTNFQGMSNGIEGVSKKFLALATIGITALTNITNRAVNAGLTFAKSFSIGPILDGLHEYETNLQSIQTIQANTDQPLTKINASLNQLNHYSDLTIYNFSEMARNIGTFTAAGVDLKTATSSIKGIANMAALSGSTSQQAATAMYQLSQAISSGRVGLQDWNSVVNAGMGGKKLQNALATTAQAMGTLDKGAIKMVGPMKQLKIEGKSFRESITAKPGEKPWLSSEVLVNTLATLDGRFSKTAMQAELTATGVRKYSDAQIDARIAANRLALEQKNGVKYTDAQFKSLQKLSDSSFLAATQVKTLGQVFDVAKETIGSGWSATFTNVFGTFGEAKTTFTELSGAINNFINRQSLARNTMLKSWHDMGGRTALIQGLKNAFGALSSVLKPLTAAFREIFPKKTAADLYNLTTRFRDLMERLKVGPETAAKLKSVFAGVFAVFDIGKQIVMGIFHALGQLFGTVTKNSGGVLTFAAHIGDMVVAFDKALKQGDLLKNFFRVIANIIAIPIQLVKTFASAIGEMFSGFHIGDAKGMTDSVSGASAVMSHAADVTERLSNWFGSLTDKIRPAVQWIVHAFSGIGHAIAQGLGSAQFSNILKGLQTGLLAGILLTLKKFMSGGLGGIHIEPSGGIFGKIKGTLDGLTESLKTMTLQIKAKILLEIAAAIGIITLSVVALSNINSAKLAVALKAMAVGFGELLGAMAILVKISSSAGFIKLPLVAASLDLLAGAILILTAAVAVLSRMSWDELKKGLTAVGILLGAVSAASIPLSANSAGMIRAGVGITAIAVALNLLAVAVKLYSMMSWSDMLHGLAGVGIALGGIAIAMRLMPKGMVLQAAALNLIATAINALYFAVKDFAKLSWKDMVKGLVGVAGGLLAIALGMKAMPPGILLQAAALNLISLALLQIDKAVANMAQLGWAEIGKGLAGLGGALLILAGGLFLMQDSIGGAVALGIVAAALHIFVPALAALGSMSWGTILKGLGALAIAFGVLGLSALVLMPVIPAMLALGVALGLVSVAILAFGAGAALLGIGLTAIAASGGAAIAVLIGGLKSVIELLPELGKNLALGLVNFITIIGKNAPTIIGAFVKLLKGLLDAVPKILPSLITAIGSLITAILKVLVDNTPKIIEAGFKLLMDLLKGIRDHIGEVVTTVTQIIVKFLDALASNIGKIVAAGVHLLFKFLEGVAKQAGAIPAEVVKIVGIFLKSLFSHLGELVSAGAKLLGKLISGIMGKVGDLIGAAGKLIARFVGALGGLGWKLLSAGAKMLGKLVSGILGAVGGFLGNIASAGWRLAKSLIGGLVDGIHSGVSTVKSAMGLLSGETIDASGVTFGTPGGPSRVFCKIGESLPLGLADGIESSTGTATKAVKRMSSTTLLAMKKTISGLGDAINADVIELSPKITPVLDLAQVRKDASQISGLMSTSPINASVSIGQADVISAKTVAAAESVGQDAPVVPQTVVNYEQNNYSPKALSTVDIYRGTKNQLAQAKSLAGIPSVPKME